MTYFSKFNDLWNGAMLAALTACMAVGLADVARAGPADTAPAVKVSYGDLDLANAQGVQTLHARISAAAQRVCAPDGLEIRNLNVYMIERACIREAVANAESAVQATRVASLGAHRDQG